LTENELVKFNSWWEKNHLLGERDLEFIRKDGALLLYEEALRPAPVWNDAGVVPTPGEYLCLIEGKKDVAHTFFQTLKYAEGSGWPTIPDYRVAQWSECPSLLPIPS
jgi:hypothetical protein